MWENYDDHHQQKSFKVQNNIFNVFIPTNYFLSFLFLLSHILSIPSDRSWDIKLTKTTLSPSLSTLDMKQVHIILSVMIEYQLKKVKAISIKKVKAC